MKKSEKIITGMIVGAVVAMFMIPKSRKMIYDTICNISGSLKNVMNKADHIVANA